MASLPILQFMASHSHHVQHQLDEDNQFLFDQMPKYCSQVQEKQVKNDKNTKEQIEEEDGNEFMLGDVGNISELSKLMVDPRKEESILEFQSARTVQIEAAETQREHVKTPIFGSEQENLQFDQKMRQGVLIINIDVRQPSQNTSEIQQKQYIDRKQEKQENQEYNQNSQENQEESQVKAEKQNQFDIENQQFLKKNQEKSQIEYDSVESEEQNQQQIKNETQKIIETDENIKKSIEKGSQTSIVENQSKEQQNAQKLIENQEQKQEQMDKIYEQKEISSVQKSKQPQYQQRQVPKNSQEVPQIDIAKPRQLNFDKIQSLQQIAEISSKNYIDTDQLIISEKNIAPQKQETAIKEESDIKQEQEPVIIEETAIKDEFISKEQVSSIETILKEQVINNQDAKKQEKFNNEEAKQQEENIEEPIIKKDKSITKNQIQHEKKVAKSLETLEMPIQMKSQIRTSQKISPKKQRKNELKKIEIPKSNKLKNTPRIFNKVLNFDSVEQQSIPQIQKENKIQSPQRNSQASINIKSKRIIPPSPLNSKAPTISFNHDKKEQFQRIKQLKHVQKKRLQRELQKIKKELVHINHQQEQADELIQEKQEEPPSPQKKQKEVQLYRSSKKVTDTEKLLKLFKDRRRNSKDADPLEFEDIDKNINSYLIQLSKIRQQNEQKLKQKKKLQIMERMKRNQIRKQHEKMKVHANANYLHQLKASHPIQNERKFQENSKTKIVSIISSKQIPKKIEPIGELNKIVQKARGQLELSPSKLLQVNKSPISVAISNKKMQKSKNFSISKRLTPDIYELKLG